MKFGLKTTEKLRIGQIKKAHTANNAYSLWRMNGCQQGFRSVASFGFGGQESASKLPQAICKTLAAILRKRTIKQKKM